jgi:hypothetical protein
MASCIVLVILLRWPADTGQLPYDYATFCIWGAVEVDIAIVSGKKPPHLDGLNVAVTDMPARLLSLAATDCSSDLPQSVP